MVSFKRAVAALAVLALGLAGCGSDEITVSEYQARVASVCESEGKQWAEDLNSWGQSAERLGDRSGARDSDSWAEFARDTEDAVDSGRAFRAALSGLDQPTVQGDSWSAQEFRQIVDFFEELNSGIGEYAEVARRAEDQLKQTGTLSGSLVRDIQAIVTEIDEIEEPSDEVSNRVLGARCNKIVESAFE